MRRLQGRTASVWLIPFASRAEIHRGMHESIRLHSRDFVRALIQTLELVITACGIVIPLLCKYPFVRCGR